MNFIFRFAFLSMLFLPQLAWSGHERGNGGAAWICSQGAYRFVEMADLQTGRAMGFHVPRNMDERAGSQSRFWLDRVEKRLEQLDPALKIDFRNEMQSLLGKVRWVVEPSGSVVKNVYDTTRSYDEGLRLCPSTFDTEYRTVGLFIDDKLNINTDLYQSLDARNKAVFWTHETIYSLCRKKRLDINSDHARLLTALLFSEDSLEPWRPAFEELTLKFFRKPWR